MSTKRKIHSAKFKAKVALEAYKGDKKLPQNSFQHTKFHQVKLAHGKKHLLAGVSQLFETKQAKIIDEETLTSPLYEEIGRLKVELDWLKKKLNHSGLL